MKKILFITHDMYRTGAPKVLLLFMQWIKRHHPSIKIIVITLGEGPLKQQFQKTSDTFLDFSKIEENEFFENTANPFLQFFRVKNNKPVVEIDEDIDVIYANTIVSIPFAVKLKSRFKQVKLAFHVHELDSVIKEKTPNFHGYSNEPDLFIAVSKIVSNNLIDNYKVHANKIKVIYEFSDLENFKPEILSKKKKFTVGGAGWVYKRKGPDLFIQVAKYISNHHPEVNIKFEWVGTLLEEQKTIIETDLYKSGLEDIVSFVGEKEKPAKHFSQFDIFLLTSREDPFPLVCIEMGMLGKPIICFENATGTAEVLKEGGGHIVPFLDIKTMAEKVLFYYENEEEKIKDGNIARGIFSQFTPEIQCPKIYNRINSLCRNSSKNN